MIVSKEHYGCAGELEPDMMTELTMLADNLWNETLQLYGHASSYEHGRAGACHARDPNDPEGPACHHFHLHILPSAIDIHCILEQTLPCWPVERLSDVVDRFYRFGDYLYFRNSKGEARFYAASGKSVPPHYMRTLISQGLGVPELGDWERVAQLAVATDAIPR